MLRWFLSLFRKREPEYALDLYKPIERYIYQYFDGEKVRKADPMVICKRLADKGYLISVDMRAANAGMKDSPKKHDDAIAAIRYVFDLKPYDQGGLTELEVVSLLEHYLTFEDYQKKTARTLPISPRATSPSTPPSSAESQPTPNTSGSGSTDAASSTGGPTPSSSGSGSPSGSSNPPSPTSST